jgi:glycosyltransferase involved in cell wall biosynthesis
MGRWVERHGGRLTVHALHDPAEARDAAILPHPHAFFGYASKRRALALRLLRACALPSPRLVVFLHPNLAPLGLLHAPSVRTLVVAHGIDVWQPLRWDRRTALMRADRVWAVSRNTAWYLDEVQGLPRARVTVVPNALGPGWSMPPATSRPRAPHLLTVSRLHPDDAYKGIDLLIEALARLPEADRPRFTIAGDGPDRPRLEGLALRLGVFAHFLGRLSDDDLRACFRQATAFALPSAGEGFGLVYLEAMAHGLPCIAARAGGAPEVVIEGETGVVVPPRDVSALAAAIVRVLGEDGERLGASGRLRVESNFLQSHYEARVHAAMAEVLGA